MSGTPRRVTGWSVSRVAQRIGSTAFLLADGITRPRSGRPPRTIRLANQPRLSHFVATRDGPLEFEQYIARLGRRARDDRGLHRQGQEMRAWLARKLDVEPDLACRVCGGGPATLDYP